MSEASQKPVVHGTISPEANQMVQAMRQQTTQGLLEVGRLELRKNQILRHLAQMEEETRKILAEEAKRLGIPEGSQWELTPEGLALGPPE